MVRLTRAEIVQWARAAREASYAILRKTESRRLRGAWEFCIAWAGVLAHDSRGMSARRLTGFARQMAHGARGEIGGPRRAMLCLSALYRAAARWLREECRADRSPTPEHVEPCFGRDPALATLGAAPWDGVT